MDGKSPRKPRSWKRRVFRTLTLLFVLALVATAALPWLIATPPARSAIVARLNRVLAPSRVAIRGISASWIGPIKLTGLTLRNKDGKTLIDAKLATLDRGFLALARRPNSLGTLTVDGAAVDIERKADGSIDLVDALVPPRDEPVVDPAPEAKPQSKGSGLSLTLRVTRASLRLTTPELAGPLVAESMDMEVTLPDGTNGQPLGWKIRLAQPAGGTAAETLGVDGTYDLRAGAGVEPDLSLTVKGELWPLTLAGKGVGAAGLEAKARLDGLMAVARKGGQWAAVGDTRLVEVDATGGLLAGDRLRLDKVAAALDVRQTPAGWDVRRLVVKSPLGDVNGSGTVGGDGATPEGRAEATVDLAALARQVPHALRLREGLTLERGSARIKASLTTAGDARTGSVDASLSDLAARDATHAFTLRDPASVVFKATLSPRGLALQTLDAKAAFLSLTGSGDLDKGINATGTLDLAALETQFKDLIDFGAVKLAGKGRLAADFRKVNSPTGPAFVGRYAAEVRGLKVAGLTSEPIERDSARFDGIVSGPSEASGMPRSWESARVTLKSSRDSVVVAGSVKDGVTSVSASASVPLKVLERDGQADAVVVGRWKPGKDVVELDQLRLGLRPLDPALVADGTVALAVRGTIDLAGDVVNLTPLAVPAGGRALSLSPQGLSLKNLKAAATAGRQVRVFFTGDAGALDRAYAVWSNQPGYGLAGALGGQVVVDPAGDGRLTFAVGLQAPDLSRATADGKGRQPEGPLTLAATGSYDPKADRLDVAKLGVVTRYAVLTGSAKVADPAGRRVVDAEGTLTPSWGALTAMAAEAVEPNMRLAGGARPFRIKGPLSGSSTAAILKGLEGEVGLDLASADAFGLRLGPAPLVVHMGRGGVTMDPVNTTLNGGAVALLPGLDVDEVRGIALTIAPGSTIQNAEINDEVSRRVLRYVAPVLDKATHVNGKVSVTLQGADIPISAPPERKLNLTGRLVFQDVVFAPGPLASEVLTLAGQPGSQGLKLHQPVQLAVADGRVVQQGLEIPIRPGAAIALDGSVGFDETLDLRASVPVTGGMIGNAPGLEGLIKGKRIVVPIGGTVNHPQINRQALRVALRELTRGVVKEGLSQEAKGLLNQVVPGSGGQPGAGAGADDPLRGLENQLFRRVIPGGGAAAPNRQP